MLDIVMSLGLAFSKGLKIFLTSFYSLPGGTTIKKAIKSIPILMFLLLSEELWWLGQRGLIDISPLERLKFSLEALHLLISGWALTTFFFFCVCARICVCVAPIHIQRVRIPSLHWFNFCLSNRGGQWNSGGHCKQSTRPLNTTLSINYPEKNIIVEEVIKQMQTPAMLLNITGLSEFRIDGHPSIYGRNQGKVHSSIQDCSHWCLPGVPDAWNELLYFYLLSKQKPLSTD